jgi:RNA polymerase sigma-B factor
MHETGRPPTPREIAGDLGLEVDVVSEALTADGCFSPSSLDRPAADDATASLSDVLGERDPGFERAEAVVALRPLCQQLSERDRRIVYLRFFHEWTQARIAEEFGVTQMQVSRLLTRILKQLRSQLGAVDGSPEDDIAAMLRRSDSADTAATATLPRRSNPREARLTA